MKKLFYLLSLSLLFITLSNCEEDGCNQDALCSTTSTTTFAKTADDDYPDEWENYKCEDEDDDKTFDNTKILICHNGQSICVAESAVQAHLNHGDTLGECSTLNVGDLVFRNGEVVSIPCKYTLPFIHVDENGQQWIYTVPE